MAGVHATRTTKRVSGKLGANGSRIRHMAAEPVLSIPVVHQFGYVVLFFLLELDIALPILSLSKYQVNQATPWRSMHLRARSTF